MAEFIVSFFFDLFIDLIGYSVARLALPLFSFGRIYAQSSSSSDNGFNMFGYRHDGKGRIEISWIVASSLGLVIALVALASFGVLISTHS